jgi:predicted permease
VIGIAAIVGAATVVGIGAEHRLGDRAEQLAQRMMDTILWVILPVVAFVQLAALRLDVRVGAGILFAWAAVAITLLAAYAIGRFALHLPRTSTGALMNASAFGNTGYLGLPFAAALFGLDALPNAVAYDTLVSALTLVTVAFTVGAVFGTTGERPRERLAAFVKRNPPLWASVAGLLAPAALAPEWAVTASQALVFLMLPLGFFAVGVTLASEAGGAAATFPPPLDAGIATAIALKLLLPAAIIAGLSALIIDVPDPYLTQAAMATGINTIIVANAYGLDRRLTAATIAWTTMIVVAVGLVVWPG